MTIGVIEAVGLAVAWTFLLTQRSWDWIGRLRARRYRIAWSRAECQKLAALAALYRRP